jgi:hypothetical protein
MPRFGALEEIKYIAEVQNNLRADHRKLFFKKGIEFNFPGIVSVYRRAKNKLLISKPLLIKKEKNYQGFYELASTAMVPS